MAIFRTGAMVVSAAMTLGLAGSAFAIDSKASCEYEGGETFDMPNGAVVCVIQLRPEAYHGEEYDDAQLGVKSCDDGVMLEDGLFCKLTLREGTKPKATEAAAEMTGSIEAPSAKDVKKDVGDKVIQKAKDAVK